MVTFGVWIDGLDRHISQSHKGLGFTAYEPSRPCADLVEADQIDVDKHILEVAQIDILVLGSNKYDMVILQPAVASKWNSKQDV